MEDPKLVMTPKKHQTVSAAAADAAVAAATADGADGADSAASAESVRAAFHAPEGPQAAPPLRVLSLSLKTVLNPGSHVHEIAVCSGIFHNEVRRALSAGSVPCISVSHPFPAGPLPFAAR